MGVVNVTPDSFSDGGAHFSETDAASHAATLTSEGAHMLDLGGESTRPGAEPVSLEEERRRVLPAIRAAVKTGLPVSIDTRKAAIMGEAVAAGAAIINDVSALRHDEKALETAADLQVPVILMHMAGTPETMQNNPTYTDVVDDVEDFLENRLSVCIKAGIREEHLWIDPGIGFGKTLEHNLALMRHLSRFRRLGRPIVFGASRKRFIEALDRAGPAAERDAGTIAACLHAVAQGADVLRVHNVGALRQALNVFTAIDPDVPDA
jgi:dihydropteroate synthase